MFDYSKYCEERDNLIAQQNKAYEECIKFGKTLLFKTAIKLIKEKVQYNKPNRHVCENVIRELNCKIDLDFVKQSEFIENNHCVYPKSIYDESCKILVAEPSFCADVPLEHDAKEAFMQQHRNNYKNSSLVIMSKDNVFVCPYPKHLGTLAYALRAARHYKDAKEANDFEEMQKNELSIDFISSIHKKMYEDTEFDNDYIIGYGSPRKTFYYNGDWLHSNVKLETANWTPTDSDYVEDMLQNLITLIDHPDEKYGEVHPVLKAMFFKTRYIQIHPFRDCNGRTSRILLNYILTRNGYPTITIKAKHKERYIEAMNKAIDFNDYSNLFTLMVDRLNSRCDKYIEIINEYSTNPMCETEI